MEFSRQKYWSGLPFPSLGDLPSPGIETGSPALQAGSLLPEPPGEENLGLFGHIFCSVKLSHLRNPTVRSEIAFAFSPRSMNMSLCKLDSQLALIFQDFQGMHEK